MTTPEIELWEVSSGKKIKTFKADEFWGLSVNFSGDGKRLYLSGDGDNDRTVWNIGER